MCTVWFRNETKLAAVVSAPVGAPKTVYPGGWLEVAEEEQEHYSSFSELTFYAVRPPDPPYVPRPKEVEPHTQVRPALISQLTLRQLQEKAKKLGVALRPGMQKSEILWLLTGSQHQPSIEALHVKRQKPAAHPEGPATTKI